jgi:hypothetical protein
MTTEDELILGCKSKYEIGNLDSISRWRECKRISSNTPGFGEKYGREY